MKKNRRKWKKKLYWAMPKDLAPGRYTCILKVSDNGKTRLFVRIEEKECENTKKS